MKKIRVSIIAIAAAILGTMAFAGSALAARGADISPGGTISGTSVGRITLSAGDLTTDCNLTLRGNLNSGTIEKVVDAEIGTLTSVTITNCRSVFGIFSVSASVLGSGIAVRYTGFQGTLPRVTGIDLYLDDIQFQVVAAGFLTCLYQADVPGRLATSWVSGNDATTGNITILSNRASLVRGAGCPSTGSLSGASTVAPTQTITLVD
jgi:hypothetical protein